MLAETVVGIVFGIFFGIIFVVACLVSAVKAVRDRKQIKRRIEEKERVKEEAKVILRQQKMAVSSIEEKYITQHIENERGHGSVNGKNSYNYGNHSGKHKALSGSRISSSDSHNALSVTRNDHVLHHNRDSNGVDNMTYAHSHSDMRHAHKTKSKQIVTADRHPHKLMVPSSRTLSGGLYEKHNNKRVTHLPKECLAVQKILRRHSYEVAVCENSWLPIEPPMFASSQSIMQTYNFGHPSGANTSTVGFINSAYDKEDHKKT